MIPSKLKPKDTIAIVAPSDSVGKKDLEAFNRSILLLEQAGYQLKFGKHLFSNTTGYGATVAEKVEDLHHMYQDPEVKMIWAAKGGGNSNSLFEALDYELIKANPKILCGYSDTTSILNMIHEKTGCITYMGETFKGLTTWQTNYSFLEILKRLEQASLELGTKEDTYETIQQGVAQGQLVGGNLTLISRMIAGKYTITFQDKLLFIEELGLEAEPCLVSNALYYMKQNGIFDQIKGLWLGNYEHISAISLKQIVLDTIGNEYDFPIIYSNNFGHTDHKTVIPIGTKAKIDTSKQVKIELIENCVR